MREFAGESDVPFDSLAGHVEGDVVADAHRVAARHATGLGHGFGHGPDSPTIPRAPQAMTSSAKASTQPSAMKTTPLSAAFAIPRNSGHVARNMTWDLR